jgi:dihydroorotate dehydrogenase (fumarate)
MVDLSTTYLGMKLRSPLVPSASPLSESIDNIRIMEDSGAAAVVLRSLFEEQIAYNEAGTGPLERPDNGFPEQTEYVLSPEQYLNHIRKAKEAVDIPIIASLNASGMGGWVDFARQIEQAGADALELNIYYIPADPNLPGSEIENIYIKIVENVRSTVSLPLAVKLSPFFSNPAEMAGRFKRAGANALVLFNRFYQPDIDPETLSVISSFTLSTSESARLPLRWIAILHGRIGLDLAASGGIHTVSDVVKMLMAGASLTMLCSVLLQNRIFHIKKLEAGLREWLEAHNYESVRQIQGVASQQKSQDPSAFERAHYIRTLQSYDQQLSALRSLNRQF